MKLHAPEIPKKYRPEGIDLIHEDLDLIIGNKAAGYLTVAARWNRDKTIHSALNEYIRKGNSRSKKSLFVVHRLDQATSGVLIFAKSEEAQQALKNNWGNTIKTYYAIVHGHLSKKSGIIESYLEEDEDYFVKSTSDANSGKLAKTQYKVVQEVERYSLLKINLLTGKKNQIRVHLSEQGHPIVGDSKYGNKSGGGKFLLLHSHAIEFDHPHSKKRITAVAPVPEYFKKVINFDY
jgi:RluA family pseudouridine synthase